MSNAPRSPARADTHGRNVNATSTVTRRIAGNAVDGKPRALEECGEFCFEIIGAALRFACAKHVFY